MGKYMNVVLAWILPLVIGGCSSDDDNSFWRKNVDSFATGLRDGQVLVKSDFIIAAITSISNDIEKVTAMKYFAESLWGVDISHLKYPEQKRVIQEVNDCALKIAAHLGMGGLSLEDAYEVRVQWLKWQRKNIERLRPKRDIDVTRYSRDERLRYEEWKVCYESLVYSHEAVIRWIEISNIPLECENLPSEVRALIVEKIERFLGRKLRTPQEAECAKGELTESQEMKAVRRGEVGP